MRLAALVTTGLAAVLLLLGLVFYRERMLFLDAPHILFRIVNDGRLQITEHRWGSFITQAVPYLCARLHVPIRGLLVAYSASFPAFFLVVSCVLVFVYRNYRLAILGGLYYTLFASAAFYWTNNEVHQGITWLLLSLGTMDYMAEKKVPPVAAWLVSAVLLGLSIWTHPLVALVALFLWVYGLLYQRPASRKVAAATTATLLALAALKYLQGTGPGYDSTKIESVTGFQWAQLAHIWWAPQLGWLLHGCLVNYWLVVVLLVWGIVALVQERRFLLLAAVTGAVLLYLLLMLITFWNVTDGQFYMESEYMPLAIIACTPFVFHALPKLRAANGAAILAFVYGVRLVYILLAAAPFQQRVATTQAVLQQMRNKRISKAVIPPTADIERTMMMTWAAPVESILLSALEGEQPQRTIVWGKPEEQPHALTSADTFIGCWEVRSRAQLNPVYFAIDTAQHYTVISYDSLMR